MNTAFWRVVWKEYRAVRGFWIAVFVLAILVQVAFAAVLAPGGDRVESVYGVALGAAALFVVGCMAAAFAAEREEETLNFLQIVPGTWRPVVGGKLAFAGLSTALLIGTLVATAAALVGGGATLRSDVVDALAVFGVAVLECAAWAALFSLLSRRPLVAAVGAIAVASMATHVAIWFADPGRTQVWSAATYREAWHTRLALAAGVATVAGLVSRKWLAGAQVGERRRKQSPGRSRLMAGAATAPAALLRRGHALPIVGRLLWQSLRQWWWVALLWIVLAGPVVGILARMLSLMSDTSIVPWWTGLAAVVGALSGTLVFLSDQEGRRYRFFAERAERPGLVWLARLMFWGGAIAAMATVMHVGLGYGLLKESVKEALEVVDRYWQDQASSGSYSSWYFRNLVDSYEAAWSHVMAIAFSTLILICGFCIGQFCSMAVKSGVIAGFAAVIGSLVVLAWGALMVAWQLHAHLKWGFVLVPLCLLLATRLRARGWLLERKSVRAWMLPANVLLVPLAIVVLSVPAARLNLPVSQWGSFSRDAFQLASQDFEQAQQSLTVEGRDAADFYLRGSDQVTTWQSFLSAAGKGDFASNEYELWTHTDEYSEFRDRWLEDNADALAFALDAAGREACYFPSDLLISRRVMLLQELQQVVIQSGNQQLRHGDLATALDRYIAALRMTDHYRQGQRSRTWNSFSNLRAYRALAGWARADGQTPELLRRAVAALEQYPTPLPMLESAVLADHVHIRSILDGEKDPDAANVSIEGWRMQLAYMAHLLPWERERARVVLDALSGLRFQLARNFVAAMEGKLPLNAYINDWLYRHRDVSVEQDGMSPYSWLETTYYLVPLYKSLSGLTEVIYGVITDEQRRRALLVETALIAYRLEHGDYPEELYELEEDYLAAVPEELFGLRNLGGQIVRDRPFQYHPEGLDGWLQSPEHRLIPPGTPLLWSGGATQGSELLLIDEQIQAVPLERDRFGRAIRSQDLGGRPLYALPAYQYDDRIAMSTITLIELPIVAANGEAAGGGRDPRDDGVQIAPFRATDYGPVIYGYGATAAAPYAAAGGFGTSAPFSSGYDMDGIPPGYDLPPLD